MCTGLALLGRIGQQIKPSDHGFAHICDGIGVVFLRATAFVGCPYLNHASFFQRARIAPGTLPMTRPHSRSKARQTSLSGAKGAPQTAVLYRMELPNYTCGYGTAARDLLRREGFEIKEHILRTRRETDAFKDKHHVTTTPLIWIDGDRIGGFTDLQRYLKKQKPRKAWFRRS